MGARSERCRLTSQPRALKITAMNHLTGESSPYLLQHKDNPVEWYPWGKEALRRAADEDKPIFVSIGYSSCHWCHVMAHESFEDDEVAGELGKSFISIKVDREERPDVDAVYMAALLALTGSGGWPMSVFCTPDGRPFFAGTYFPPSDRYQMPSFRRIVAALADAWKTRRDEIEEQADAVTGAIKAQGDAPKQLEVTFAPGTLPDSETCLNSLITYLKDGFDPEWGGFGPAPKFPRPTLIELCLRHHEMTGDELSLEMATRTLDAMARGGIYDHLAGGFCRYSTDRTWTVPHFEKMLTDQALLARCYLHAWQYTKNDDYLLVVRETIEYMLNGLWGNCAGLYSSEDADSAGVEGAHATFTTRQFKEALVRANREDLRDELGKWYGITPKGNWEGTNILRRPLDSALARTPEIDEGRKVLLAARLTRRQPSVDTKVVTEWNAIALATLAEAAGALAEVSWERRCVGIAEFLLDNLCDSNGRWLRSWADGHAKYPAYACDHAWLVDAFTRLAELTGETRWLERAVEVAEVLLSNFSETGGPECSAGLFTTAADADTLVVRLKDWTDGATPCANSVAARALIRLSMMSGEERFRSAGERIIEASSQALQSHPAQIADMLQALSLCERATQIVARTDREELIAEIRDRWLMDAVVITGEIAELPAFADSLDNAVSICRNFTCMRGSEDRETLSRQLDSTGSGAFRQYGAG